MSDQDPQEIWQVEAGGQVYQAPFGELGSWIAEGSLLPHDRVRKGNLRWIEAQKVPNLIPFFNEKKFRSSGRRAIAITTQARPRPETSASTATENPGGPRNIHPSPSGSAYSNHFAASDFVNPKPCFIHLETPAVYLCGGCARGFCKACPSSYGSKVKICPACGSMCRPLSEVDRLEAEAERYNAALTQGFGVADFFNAINHPWKFKTSLFFGALIFSFFTVGQTAAALGGILMMVAALFCVMLANMLGFGVLANTVRNFSRGELAENFMPTFDDFSLWDDVVHPFLLSIGAYAVSFGPFLVMTVIGLHMVFGSAESRMDALQSDLKKLPGTHYYDSQRTVEQSEAVKKVLGEFANNQRDRLAAFDGAAAGNGNVPSKTEEFADQKLIRLTEENRKARHESAFGKSPETREFENEAMLQGFLNLSAPLVVGAAILLLWGLFYFPAACAIAGYTRSLAATVDPTVGLDTIRRLGTIYLKILLMSLVLLVVSAIVTGLLRMLFLPFDLPGLGSIPAKAAVAMFAFYISVVFSCVLGYALFKASDRLALPH